MWLFLDSGVSAVRGADRYHVLYRGRSIERRSPFPHDDTDIPYTSVSAFVLLASSLTMVLALAAAQEGDKGRTRLWLIATALLGMVFVGGQVYEFTVFATRAST